MRRDQIRDQIKRDQIRDQIRAQKGPGPTMTTEYETKYASVTRPDSETTVYDVLGEDVFRLAKAYSEFLALRWSYPLDQEAIDKAQEALLEMTNSAEVIQSMCLTLHTGYSQFEKVLQDFAHVSRETSKPEDEDEKFFDEKEFLDNEPLG